MLKQARKETGLSTEAAAFSLHIGRRTLINYENGQTVVPQEVVLRMAEVYGKPDLLARYCSNLCPIGQCTAHCFEKDHMASMVLGLLKEFEDVDRLRSRIISIAADDRLDESEKPEFQAIMREVVELEKAIGELKQFSLRNGIAVEDLMPERDKKIATLAAAQ